jgi:hypothetical protein
MATYKNEKPSMLGLNHTNFRAVMVKDKDGKDTGEVERLVDVGAAVRLINPGETFEASPAEIPQPYLDKGWIKLLKADPEPEVAPPAPLAPPEDTSKGKAKA